jgi:hypothetical protein
LYHWEQAAILGSKITRYNLGVGEHNKGDINRAMKHYMIAISKGHEKALAAVRYLFMQSVLKKLNTSRHCILIRHISVECKVNKEIRQRLIKGKKVHKKARERWLLDSESSVYLGMFCFFQ